VPTTLEAKAGENLSGEQEPGVPGVSGAFSTDEAAVRSRERSEVAEEGPPMGRLEKAVAGMEDGAAEIEALCGRLMALHRHLPVTEQEAGLEDLGGDAPVATVLRSALANVVTNCLRPAAEDLRKAAAYRPQGSWRTWDLTADSEETRSRLYELVVEQCFTGRSGADPDDTWVPPYTAEQARLRVWFQHGRWLAEWRKLEVPESAPEEEQWELLLLDENEQAPGTLLTREI
jgi:hypothetical protein